MRIPVWLTLAIAILVILFGIHRLRLSLRSETEPDPSVPRKGLYAMSKRAHLVIGLVYLLLGAALVATSFGWAPFADYFDSPAAGPTKDSSRSTRPVAPTS